MNNSKVLKVIHGYPPYYMAGSEVYTYNLCNELKKRVNISIFTRIEDIFSPLYQIKQSTDSGIRIIRVNKPKRDYTFRDKYIDKKLGKIFERYLQQINPDIVHIGHLSHLTVLIVDIVKKYNIPIIFTLHDYWMICVRGQLIRGDKELCDGPTVEKCLECNKKYFINEKVGKREIQKWLKKMRVVNDKIDLFIAPSGFLKNIYIKNGFLPEKIIYMDYGFKKELFYNIKKKESKKLRFGFMGRIIPVKGIDLLIECFNDIDPKKAQLNIYGRIDESFQYLKHKIRHNNVYFYGGYNYLDIGNVLSNIDVLVVPSIWYENSPLVIHEAILSGIPVITSNLGGMAELIENEKNGLLFESRDIKDLKDKITRFIEQPELISQLTNDVIRIRSIQEDADYLIKIYNKLIRNERVIGQIAQTS